MDQTLAEERAMRPPEPDTTSSVRRTRELESAALPPPATGWTGKIRHLQSDINNLKSPVHCEIMPRYQLLLPEERAVLLPYCSSFMSSVWSPGSRCGLCGHGDLPDDVLYRGSIEKALLFQEHRFSAIVRWLIAIVGGTGFMLLSAKYGFGILIMLFARTFSTAVIFCEKKIFGKLLARAIGMTK